MDGIFWGNFAGAKRDVNKLLRYISKEAQKKEIFMSVWRLVCDEAETLDAKQVIEYIKTEYEDEGEIDFEFEIEGEIPSIDLDQFMADVSPKHPDVLISFSITESSHEDLALCYNKEDGKETYTKEKVKQ